MKHIRWIVILLVMLIVIALTVQNYESLAAPVRFKTDLLLFKYESATVPLSLVVVVAFVVGVVASGLYGIMERFRLRRQLKAVVKDLREKEKELNSLRNLPVTTEVMGASQGTAT